MLIRKSIYIIVFLCTFFLPQQSFGKGKKKQPSQYKKATLIQKAWGDLTTRNNWYFNANERYKELLRQNALNFKIDFSKEIPFYWANKDNLKSYTSELQQIEKKMGIVLQIRNYGRWRDNAYLLLGKAQYFQNKIDTSLITFQYIVTTMKPEKMNAQVGLSNKARLKYLQKRQKEIKKKAGENQKIIELKLSQQKKDAAKKADELKQKQAEAIANKKKSIEEIIKAKKKIIALQKKGKKIPPELLAKVKKSSTPIDSTAIKQKQQEVQIQKKQEQNKNQPYILLDDEWIKNPYYIDTTQNRKDENPLADLSKKEDAKWDKLTFWEKIKHKKSRPEALVWMARSLIDMNRYADAQSMIAYAKALRKLTTNQKKDIFLISAYYQLNSKNIPLTIEELENAMPFIKKKQEKAYYEFLLAQLYKQNDQPADAVDYFVKNNKHTNDDKFAFYSKLKMADIFAKYPGLSDANIEKMLAKLVRFGKNKDQADEVYYELANYALNNNKDTAQALIYLDKSVKLSTSNSIQKGLSYLLMGKINFDTEKYAVAKLNYDSAVAFIPKENFEYPEAITRQSVLDELAKNREIVSVQDSLQRLGKMSPKELAQFLAEKEAEKEKINKKKSRISIEDNVGGGNVDLSAGFTPQNYSSNGLWYFYNDELKSKGYNQFKAVWGNRPFEINWRRSSKSIFDTEDGENTTENVPAENENLSTDKNSKQPTKETKVDIPKTPEDFIASDKKIANALFNIGVVFKNKLQNIPKAKQAFDELIRRFPNSEFDAIAHYYQYLIYLEQDLKGLASKEKNYILENYPLSDVAAKLQEQPQKVQETTPTQNQNEALYAQTYQAYLNDDFETVLNNKKLAQKSKMPDEEMAKIDFLEAMVYGKQKVFKKYKLALSDIVLKYPNTEVKKKAQEYLIALIQFENGLEDSTKTVQEMIITPQKSDTTNIEQIEFNMDTSDFMIVVRLNDSYFKLQQVVSDLQGYCESKASNQKVKVNPVFFEKGEALITLKRFDDMEIVSKLLLNLNIDKQKLFNEKANSVSYYVISTDNFKKIKSFKDLDTYEQFFTKKYINNE